MVKKDGKTEGMRRLDGIYNLGVILISQRVRRFGFLALLMAMVIGMALTGALPNLTQGEAGAASPTRLWSSGAELNSTTANMEITGTSGTMSISSSTKRSGDYAYRANPTSSTGTFYKTWANSAQSNKFWFRTYLWIADDPSADTYALQVGNGASGKISVRLTTTSTLQLRNEEDNANIGSASSALAANTWYRVEVFVDTTTLSSTDAELRLDGVSVASSTAENLAAGVDRFTWGSATSGTTDLFFDDLAINNSSGRSDNWPGEGKIVHLQPNADGDSTAWVGDPSDVNDYDDVDEVTPNDDTDFIRSQTNNQVEDINLESASNAGITSNDYIKLVSVGVRQKICGNATGGFSCLQGNGDINYQTRLKASAGGTTEESAITGIDDTVSGYSTNNDDSAKLNALTLYDLPGSSTTPWTTTDLDAAQVGIRNNDANGTGFRLTAIWLQVEYTPKSGGRLFSSGFELNSTTANEEWSTIDGSPTISTTTVRSGTYAGRISSLASGTRQAFNYQLKSANADGTFYLRTYFRIATAPSAENRIVDFRTSGGTAIAYVTADASRVLRLYDEDGQVTGTTTLAAATWVRLEIKFLKNGASSEVTARVNGTNFASATNRDLSTGVTQFGLGGNMISEAQTAGDWFFDDVALNEGGGIVQSSYPGSGRIIHLRPNATGDNSETWTSAGDLSEAACDTIADPNWQCLDEVTPDEAVSLIEETTTGNSEDFNLDDSPIGASDAVRLVSVGVRFRTSSATQEDFRVRLKDNASAVPIESDLLSPASTTWVTNRTTAPYSYPLIAYTRPEQGTAWTDSQLDTAQIGVRDISGSGTVQVSSLWLLVEYNPVISGTVYGTDETTAVTSGPTVRAYVNGSITDSVAASTTNGTYTISDLDMVASDSLVVYLDGATEKAATYSRASGNSLTGFDLYRDRVATRCDNACSLTNTNIDGWDKSNDSDIHAGVTLGSLTVDNDWKLLVKANTYAPSGSVTTTNGGSNSYSGDLEIAAGATLTMSANALSVGGSFTNNGTFTTPFNTTTLTSTDATETLKSNGASFYNFEIDNGLIGYWKLDDSAATAGTANDSSGDGNNLTGTGSPSYTTSVKDTAYYGRNNAALTFSGSNYLSATASTSLKPSNDITVAGWMKASATDTSGAELVSMGDDYSVRITTAGDVQVSFYDGAAWRTCTSSGANVLDNAWHSIVYLKSSSSGQKIYIDNVQRDPGTGDCTNTSAISYAHGTTFNIGRHGNGNTNYDFAGTADDVRVYKRVLSTTEIADWNSGNHPTSATFTLQDALDVNTTLGIRTGKLDVSSSNYGITLGGTYRNVANFDGRAGTFTFDGTIVGFNLQSDPSFYNFSVSSSSGGVLLNLQRFSASNNLTLTGRIDASSAGCALATACNVSVGNNLTSSGTAWTITGQSATWTVSGNWDTSSAAQDSLNINEGTSTVVLNGSGTKTVKTGTTNTYEARFYNLQVGNSSTKTTQMLQGFGVSGVLTLGPGTIDLNSQTLYITGNTASPLSLDASGTFGTGTGTLSFYGSLNMTIPAFTYKVDVKTEVSTGNKVIQGGAVTISGSLLMACCSRQSEWDTNNQSLTVGLDVQWIQAGGILTAGSSSISVGRDWKNGLDGVFTAGTSTVTMTSAITGRTIEPGTDSFYNLTFNGSGGWSFNAAGTVTNDLTMTTGTLSGTQNLTVNGHVQGTGGAFNLTGGTFEQRVAANKNFGTTSGSTAWRFRSLTFSNSSGSPITVSVSTGGSGYLLASGDVKIGKSGDAAGGTTTLNAGNRLWGLRSNTGTPLTILSSPQGALTQSTSRFMYSGSNSIGNTTVANTTYYNLDINDGLVGYWNLNDGSGTSAADVSGYGVTGTLGAGAAAPVWSSTVSGSNYYGRNTNSLDFDGGDSVTLSSTNDLPSGANARTMCAWAKTDTTANGYRIIAAYGTASTGQAMFIGLNGTTLYGGGYGDDITVSSYWDTTNWKNICLVYNGSQASLYSNGSLVAGPTAKTWNLTKNNAYIGSQVDNTQGWDGLVDDIRIYDRALSSTEITALSSGVNPAGNETYDLAANAIVNNDLGIGSGTLDVVSGQNYSVTISGGYGNYGTLTARNGTFTFDASSTGKILTGTLNGSSAFYNLTFNGSGGGWSNSSAMTATNDLTMTNGTLSGTNDVTVNGHVQGTAGTFNFTGGAFEQRVAANKNFGTTSGVTNWSFNNLTFSDGEGAICLGVSITTQTGGSGGISVANVLKVGKSGDTCATSLGAGNRNWTLSGVGGDPFQLLASPAGTLSAGSSTFAYTGNCSAVSCNTTIQAGTYNHLTINNTLETFVLEGATVANGNLTITNGTLDTVAGQNYDLAVKGNWTNNGTFTARNGTVTLSGSATQTLSGAMTGSSSFYKLTLTNSSGTDASDCERTSFVPGIDFAASASVTNNYTITTASARVEYNDGSTYTIANINWNGQASGTRIYFRSSATSGDWNLNVSGTQTAVSYVNVSRSDAAGGNTIGAHNGTNLDCGNNVNWSFAIPINPANLAQKKTDNTVIATGGWTNETSVKFTADISDGDNPATIQLCVEVASIENVLGGTETLCGSTVNYTGTSVAASVTISGLTDTSEYWWQARVKDSGGAYSSWVGYGGNGSNARDFGIDTTPCTYGGLVYDGTTEDVDVSYNDGSLTALSSNWDAYTCTVSGLNKYQYSIGTTAGGTDVKAWTDNSTNESITSTSLNLHTNQRYFFNIRAVDNASNTSSVTSSNGQDVLPSISFSLDALTLTFANLNDNNNRSDTKTLTLTTSTNAYGGYVIRQYATGLLTGGATTIPNFQGGTYASPGSWPSAFCTSGSNCGYGYTSSDTTIGGADKFGGATLYAPFSLTAFGDVVADHTEAINGTSGAVVNEQYTLTHKVAVDALQIAKPYQTEVLYIVTGTF